jgi:transcription elongation GreA/GreB family factor
MDADIQKAVAAGKLTQQGAEVIAKLAPGSYCLHKSWGFGQIDSVNFLVNQVSVHFKGRRGHTMQLQYAADSLEPLPPGHILVQKSTNLSSTKTMAKERPVELVRTVLTSFGGRVTQDQLAQALAPEVLGEAEFKRWWETTKKALKADGHFAVPAKKTEPIELRETAVSRADELLGAFANARVLKEQLAAIEQIAKSLDAFSDPAVQLKPVIAAIEDAARKNQRLHTSQAFELVLARDEICEKAPALQSASGAVTVAQMLRDEQQKLSDILTNTPAAKQKRLLAEFPKAFGDDWTRKTLHLMLRANVRVVAELARLLQDQSKHDELRRELDRWISEHSITTEILYWLCRDREGVYGDLISPQVFSAILTALERDQFSEVKRGGKLHDLLIEDRELLPDLLSGAEPEIVRDSMRKLLLTPVFEELNKRSLIGRIIRVYPDLQSMVSGESGEKQEALIVSWSSLEKRKDEYEDLVNKKIPENSKEISVARSYGDLRENFEFKAAKEMQRVLMRRKSEMEQQLSRARGTNFENPDTTQVSIGTVVTVKDLADGNAETYTILGAWDSDPARHVISYLAAIGQVLLGKKPGEQVDLPTEHGTRQVEVVSIEAYRKAEAAHGIEAATTAAESAL